MFVWKAHAKAVCAIAFSPCGRYLLSSSGDETVRLSDRDGREVRRWPGSSFYAPVAYSADGKYVARGGHESRVWAVGGDPEPIVAATTTTKGVAFSPDSAVFVAHGNSSVPLARWSLPDGKPLPGRWGDARTSRSFPTGPLAFAPNGRTLAGVFGVPAGGRHDPVVILWDAGSGEETGRLSPWPIATPRATHLAYSPDGTLLAGVYGPQLIVWDVEKQVLVARHQPTKKHFKGLAFTPDGRHLFTTSNDQTVRVWSAPAWDATAGYEWAVGKLGGVAVSPDGTLAAAGSDTGKVIVWDVDA